MAYINYIESPFKISFGSSALKHKTEENLKWGKLYTDVTDLGIIEMEC
jgi:hypothetical protein